MSSQERVLQGEKQVDMSELVSILTRMGFQIRYTVDKNNKPCWIGVGTNEEINLGDEVVLNLKMKIINNE